MATILEHPTAQALLDQTDISPDALRGCADQLTAFIARYLPLFLRSEQRCHADTILRGKLTGLQRKTTEPIAANAKQKRRPLQLFVGAGAWDDTTVLTELRRHVRQQFAADNAVLVLDNHGVPKQGTESCAVARQWLGRLGKVDNGQVGYFLAYVAPRGKALVAARLYLPKERADDSEHRNKTYVPKEVVYQEGWRIAVDLVVNSGKELPHAWVVGDDEFGRASECRQLLRLHKERYVLDVPSNTSVRDLSERRPPAQEGGRQRLPLFERVDTWAARQPKKRWRTITRPGGTKGPRKVKALQQWVQTKEEDGRVGGRERLVVIKTCEKKPQIWYTLSNGLAEVPLAAVVCAQGCRPGVEDLFKEGNQEVGLNHYEVRSWRGWTHHMTLTLLALLFLQLERLRLAEKKSTDDSAAGARDLHGTVASPTSECGGDRRDGKQDTAA
jgi:SRSO17 transposase